MNKFYDQFKKKILVTCALPYANGPIHIGHMLEHIQADIWVRYKKMQGHEVWFICADDTHGTAMMIKAKKLNISPECLILNIFNQHKNDFKLFDISYNYYSSTHSVENLYFIKKIYYLLKLNNLVELKKVDQLYDLKEKMFLPDRLVKGTCPVCKCKNQYGDNCESCGAVYKSIDLIHPISNLSNTQPIIRNSWNIFFKLPMLTDFLSCWIKSGVLPKSMVNKMEEWFVNGLKLWSISRDTPYFGFPIPDLLDKYFYVWLDAPIAYISTFKQLCDKNLFLNFNDFWKKNSVTELYHFIGKDIIYFHSLFWPAILESIQFRKPTKIFVHGHVTFKGTKLSKSKGSIITAHTWLKYFDSDSLRYYYASKLSSKVEDIEFNLQEFENKINSDIVNKIVNLASRSAKLLNKYFYNQLSLKVEDQNLYEKFVRCSIQIEYLFENMELNSIIKKVLQLADCANQYFNEKQPWKIIFNQNHNKLHEICSMAINLFRIIVILIKPIMPTLAQKAEDFLLIKLHWKDIKIPLLNHYISNFKPLYNRLSINDFCNHQDQ